jgi:hypothetical protein
LASISIGSVNDVFDPALRDDKFGRVHVEGTGPVSFEYCFGIGPSGEVEMAGFVDAIDVREGVPVAKQQRRFNPIYCFECCAHTIFADRMRRSR